MIRFHFTFARNSPLAKIIRISVNFRRTKSIPDNRVSPCAVKGKRDKQAAVAPLAGFTTGTQRVRNRRLSPDARP